MTQPITPPVDPTPTPTPAVPPVTPPPATNGGNGQGDSDPAWLPDRLKRAEKAAEERLRKKLGLAEDEDIETAAEHLAAERKRKADELTDAQKAQAELAKEKAKREAAETELKAFQEKVEAEKREATRDSALKTALTTANAKADKVLKLLKVDSPDALSAVLKEDGTVDETKVKALVETARKAYPEDFGKGGVGSPSNNGGRVPSSSKDGEKRVSRINQSTIRG